MAKTKSSQAPAEEQPAVVVSAEPAKRLDVSVPGGRFLVNGVWVNAHGEVLADPAEETQATEGTE